MVNPVDVTLAVEAGVAEAGQVMALFVNGDTEL
jgi:hypothetical protein